MEQQLDYTRIQTIKQNEYKVKIRKVQLEVCLRWIWVMYDLHLNTYENRKRPKERFVIVTVEQLLYKMAKHLEKYKSHGNNKAYTLKLTPIDVEAFTYITELGECKDHNLIGPMAEPGIYEGYLLPLYHAIRMERNYAIGGAFYLGMRKDW